MGLINIRIHQVKHLGGGGGGGYSLYNGIWGCAADLGTDFITFGID